MQHSFHIGLIDSNPFTLALSPVFLFTFFAAVFVKLSYKNIQIIDMKKIKIVAFIAVFIGAIVWHQASLSVVKNQEANARSKVSLIETMINKSIEAHQKALSRIKARVDNVTFDEFRRLINIDKRTYTNDYNIIKGVLVLDDELSYVAGNAFSKNFYLQGMLEKPAIQTWLKQNKHDIQFAANSLTLNSNTPIIMLLASIELVDKQRFYILNLLNINLLLEKSYLEYLSQYDTYLELTPNIYFSVDDTNENKTSFIELSKNYNHFITQKINIMDLVDHNVYSFINDYKALQIDTIIDQSILWLTFIFIFIFVQVADSSRIIQFGAKHDELTGLLKLTALEAEFLNVSAAKRSSYFSTVMLRLDFFEVIHNSLGYKISDELINSVSARIQKSTNDIALIAKGANDSFVLYFFDMPPKLLEQKIESLILALSEVHVIDNQEFNLTVSGGAASYKQLDLFNVQLNIQQANIALEKAKQLGGNQVQFYQQAMEDKHNETVTIRNNLQSALKSNELDVFYQPVHCLTNNVITGVEALVRWRHGGEWISPAKFIPIAETTGQIIQVGEQVLNRVIEDIKKYPQLQNLTVAVNFSTKQIIKDNFSRNLLALLAQNNIVYKNFTVEVTESSFQEKASIEKKLIELVDSGINVAIDDFGTGYSSLSYLAHQPANIIKIDREFTIGAHLNTKEQKLLDTIIKACFDLDKKVIVEGIENEALVKHLSQFEGVRIQGYVFSKPLPINRLLEYIKNH
ncbi:bifunctional diguanylate cyclase/phosphodiesterase [Pseudoalteromonas sp.]|uniref:putative bifunctional diguanylate cyclase/phosphodiesterase n=1 Tax=Pseudoalteromonas sp. TaxID=53249 RepID=UPI00262C3FCD|nr:bifunctional diguanylate cyclase/phosphodiesterase [Pseudoalteromonas sp.]